MLRVGDVDDFINDTDIILANKTKTEKQTMIYNLKETHKEMAIIYEATERDIDKMCAEVSWEIEKCSLNAEDFNQ